jgi:hypothetical protein
MGYGLSPLNYDVKESKQRVPMINGEMGKEFVRDSRQRGREGCFAFFAGKERIYEIPKRELSFFFHWKECSSSLVPCIVLWSFAGVVNR